ncbi:hypothetical protein GALL_315010 [mine drainage metagenome]|uniref:Uncharacterized protein n=1 Tax=mine drainage metagenome TaxID=410659 RepID=A0A1J5QSM7_9ZZZZ
MTSVILKERAEGLEKPTISAQANLRQQVKPRSGGRNQNGRLAQGVPA